MVLDRTLIFRANLIAEVYNGWIPPGASVLDVGCGNAVVTAELSRKLRCRITGTDILDYRRTDIPFEKMPDNNTIPFGDRQFDVAMLNDVLHHCSDQDPIVREVGRVARSIVVFEVKPTLPARLVDVAANYIHNRRMPVPLTMRTLEEWRDLFSRLGFRCEWRESRKPFLLYPFRTFGLRLFQSGFDR